MSLTTLDARTALVLIDLQRGISSVLDPGALAQPVTAAAELAAAFRARSLPVVLVRVDFSPDRADAPRNRTGVPRPTGRPPADWTERRTRSGSTGPRRSTSSARTACG